MSSIPIINFELTYVGEVETIEFGIGLDDNLFQVIRKIIKQIFPILDQSKYVLEALSSNSSNAEYSSTNGNTTENTPFGVAQIIRNVIYNDDVKKSIELI